jgi:hypothetical protein
MSKPADRAEIAFKITVGECIPTRQKAMRHLAKTRISRIQR